MRENCSCLLHVLFRRASQGASGLGLQKLFGRTRAQRGNISIHCDSSHQLKAKMKEVPTVGGGWMRWQRNQHEGLEENPKEWKGEEKNPNKLPRLERQTEISVKRRKNSRLARGCRRCRATGPEALRAQPGVPRWRGSVTHVLHPCLQKDKCCPSLNLQAQTEEFDTGKVLAIYYFFFLSNRESIFKRQNFILLLLLLLLSFFILFCLFSRGFFISIVIMHKQYCQGRIWAILSELQMKVMGFLKALFTLLNTRRTERARQTCSHIKRTACLSLQY